MKKTIVLLVCIMFAILPAAAQTGDRSAEKAIAAMEEKWAAAQRDGKADAIAPFIADNFVNTDTDGKVSGRANLLSNMKGGKWEHSALSDVKVTVYGNTAVATGGWAGKGVASNGKKIDRHERWTDTWVKMPNGEWQCVASQQTTVEKP